MRYSRYLLAISALAAISGESLQAHAVPPGCPVTGDQHTFVLDRSKSMRELSTSTDSKWKVALGRIKSKLNEIKARAAANPALTQRFQFLVFRNGYSSTQIAFEDGYTISQVEAFVNGLTDPPTSGSTPLAGAVCDGIGKSLAFHNARADQVFECSNQFVYVYTDGLENATPDVPNETIPGCNVDCASCAGPDLEDPTLLDDPARFNPFVEPPENEKDSWPVKIFAKALTGSAEGAYWTVNPDDHVVVNTEFLFKWIPTAPASTTNAAPADDGTDGATLAQWATSQYAVSGVSAGWERYFRMVSEATGGRYVSVKPNAAGTGIVTGGSLMGDVNRDGCVGIVDKQKILQSDTMNQRVQPDKPHRYFADFNQDGWVRYSDYSILIANYGKGTCKPGDL
jgi:hypothetical protein